MKNFIKDTFLIVVLVLGCLLLVSCSAGKNRIIGTWDQEGDAVSIFEFNDDGTGEVRTDNGSTKITTWELDGSTLHAWFKNGGSEIENIYEVSFDDDNTMILSQSDFRWTYKKRGRNETTDNSTNKTVQSTEESIEATTHRKFDIQNYSDGSEGYCKINIADPYEVDGLLEYYGLDNDFPLPKTLESNPFKITTTIKGFDEKTGDINTLVNKSYFSMDYRPYEDYTVLLLEYLKDRCNSDCSVSYEDDNGYKLKKSCDGYELIYWIKMYQDDLSAEFSADRYIISEDVTDETEGKVENSDQSITNDVKLNDETTTISDVNTNLIEQNGEIPKVFLLDLEPVAGSYHIAESTKTAQGVQWDKAIWMYDGQTAEFQIDGNYKEFVAEISPEGDFDSNKIQVLEIYADDDLIYSSDKISSDTEPFNVSIDVTDKKYLKLALKNNSGYTGLMLKNAGFK